MAVRIRDHLTRLPPVPHGSISDSELASLGLPREDILDLSASTNPLGPSPAALAAARSAVWAHYPDDRASRLRRELAVRHDVDEETVVIGNGSSELIWLIALAVLDPGDVAVIVGPTFGEYARATRVAGGDIVEDRADPATSFVVDVTRTAALAREVKARLIFVCNPNNPTGFLLSTAELEALARAAPDALLVVDEAYRPFVEDPPLSRVLLDCGNVLLLRSLTKDCALAGLRLGYALAPPEVAATLDAARPPWSVNAVAQAAGLAAIQDEGHLARARDEVRRARAFLTAALGELGFPVIPSTANFILVRAGDAPAVRAQLLTHRVCVRDCTSFGLPEYVRIGIPRLADCERVASAFAAILREGITLRKDHSG